MRTGRKTTAATGQGKASLNPVYRWLLGIMAMMATLALWPEMVFAADWNPLVDTGLTTCYDVAGTLINCPAPGSPGAQDGSYTGLQPAFFPNGDGTVADLNTGLEWQQSDDGGTRTNADAAVYCEDLVLAGHSDWRLPTRRELHSLINLGKENGKPFDEIAFPTTKTSYYWTSTRIIPSAQEDRWIIDFRFGRSIPAVSNFYFTRCVRGAAPDSLGPFVVETRPDGDTVVFDQGTGLEWQRADDGVARTWQQALDYCEASTLGGYTDWRLPNQRELSFLIDETRYSPSIDPAFIGNYRAESYWSSTTFFAPSGAKTTAYEVRFYYGWEEMLNKTTAIYARCVRGGTTSSPVVLNLTKTGAGSGDILADSGVITWNGNSGTASYPVGTPVTLTSAPGACSSFMLWSGDCAGTSPTCTVIMAAAKNLTATFVSTAQPEVCDGIDNDCDGQVDEGNPGGGAYCDTGLPGVCADGAMVCSGGEIGCNQNVFPTDEVCGDALDNDCNGQADENCQPPPNHLIYTTSSDWANIATVDPLTGAGTEIGPGGPSNNGLAFDDADGTLYTINNPASIMQTLAVLDPVTGALVGEIGPLGIASCCTPAIEVGPGPAGVVYVGSLDGSFYHVDKQSGHATQVAPPGSSIQGIMDYALDQAGVLWATDGYSLFQVNRATGAAQYVSPLSGAPAGSLMGIMFDSQGRLLAISTEFNSGLYEINPATGVANRLASTGLVYAHGGDMPGGLTGDKDGDGYTVPDGDCDDNNAAIHPGAAEVCDGIDNNCDGVVDEGCDHERLGSSPACASCHIASTPAQILSIHQGNSCSLCHLSPRPDVQFAVGGTAPRLNCEACHAGLFDGDGDGYSPSAGDCDDNNEAIHPGAQEVCDGIDNNCDGQVDEGNPGGGAYCDTGLPGVCADGTTVCSGGEIGCNQDVFPTAEICGDALDNDCNGLVDENCQQPVNHLIYTTSSDWANIATVDPLTAAGTEIGPGGPSNNGLAFDDADGTLYTINNPASFSQILAALDPMTGMVLREVGPLSIASFGTPAIEVAPGPGGVVYVGSVDGSFYHVSKLDGRGTQIAPPGNSIPGVMDYALAADGTLWATDGYSLFHVNPATGVSTFISALTGAPPGSLMGIMFDNQGRLLGISTDPASGLYVIEPFSGMASLVAPTGLSMAHGGDMYLGTGGGNDEDGDGYTVADGDCDDHNAAVHPGMPEACDGIDNNCNGDVDEGPDLDGDGISFCMDNCPAVFNPDQTDADGDGYGAACDCNEANAAIHPDAVEVCDGQDNDCDGLETGCPYIGYNAHKVKASDGAAGDVFGASVAVDGDTVVVGADWDNSGAGSAYVFNYNGTTWAQNARLSASDAASFDYFGRSIGVSGNRIVVGAFADDTVAVESGSAFIFRKDGAVWAQEAKLVASDAAPEDMFGVSSAISGNVVVVGAHFNDDAGTNSGSAYVFRLNGSTWAEEAKLTADDASAGAAFGISVAVDGDTAVVGAVGANAVYVFKYDGATWSQIARLSATTGPGNFGGSVAIGGNVIAVGAYGPYSSDKGAVHVYRYDGVNWSPEATLVASDSSPGNEFGISVAVSGGTITVGAVGHDYGGTDAGAAYIYQYNGSVWVEKARLFAPDAAANDEFGYNVASSGEVVVASASGDDDNGGASGSAYIFLPSSCSTLQTYYRDNDNDTYGAPEDITKACSLPQGYVTNNADCNDYDPLVRPGVAEVCDGVDNNCNGQVDEGFDADGDGRADCRDNCPTVANPGQEDSDGNGIGDACDGCPSTWDLACGANGRTYANACEAAKAGTTVVYQGSCPAHAITSFTPECIVCHQGPDQFWDTHRQGSNCQMCHSLLPDPTPPLPPTGSCTDCHGNPYLHAGCPDQDGDHYSPVGGACGPVDCDDNNAAVHPGAPETCDGLDNNCDGVVDEDCPTIPHIYTTTNDWNDIATVHPLSGMARVLGPGGRSNNGLAFDDADGTLFTIDNPASTTQVLSVLDPVTGAVLRDVGPLGISSCCTPAIEVAPGPRGVIYVGALDGSFYHVDKQSGHATQIAPPGGSVSWVMDYVLYEDGTLVATDGYDLFVVNPSSGAAHQVATLSGAPAGSLMGIMLDSQGTLLAISTESNSGLYEINPSTGVATRLASTGLSFAHGGDMLIGLTVDTDGDGIFDPIDNCPARVNTDQLDTDGDGLGDECDLLPGSLVPPGNNVYASPAYGVDLVFDTVTGGGAVTVTEEPNPQPVANFTILPGVSYDVRFTGTFTGTISVCFVYDDTGITAFENDLRLLHWIDPDWQDITTAVDTESNIICGVTSSLSPFVLAFPDVDNDGLADAVDNCLNVSNPGQEDADHDGIGDACDPCTDGDIDGYAVEGGACGPIDCNDLDGAVYPGAPDACLGDGVDNDCDGQVDEDWVTLCHDNDGDWHGDPAHSVTVCPNDPNYVSLPPGWVSACSDCNDANPLVNPGMTEIQGNGLDDDCNFMTPDPSVVFSATFSFSGPIQCPKSVSQGTVTASITTTCTDCMPPYTYDIDWGDGSASERVITADTTITRVHTYMDKVPAAYEYDPVRGVLGTWLARWSVRDARGLTPVEMHGSDYKPVLVDACPVANVPPIANFTVEEGNGANPHEVILTSMSSDPDYNINQHYSPDWILPGFIRIEWGGPASDNSPEVFEDFIPLTNMPDNHRFRFQYATGGLKTIKYCIKDNDASSGYICALRSISIAESAPVAAGTNVTVQPTPETILTFNQVTEAGTLTVAETSPPTVPDGFAPTPGTSYEIGFDGQMTGPITVCFNYQDSDLPPGTVESGLRLLHGEGGVWVDITTSLDTAANNICGETMSLSPFVVVAPTCTPTTWYRDEDGDGHGHPLTTQAACTQPAGYVANSSDCNDNDIAVHPGAAETCDSVDNNCDGQIDEGVLLTFYLDWDGDTYGDPNNTAQACTAPSGYVLDRTDCNDTKPLVNPGRTEILGNGVDDNCNGLTDEGGAVKLSSSGVSYGSVQAAYDAAANNDVIRMQATAINEPSTLYLDNNVTVTLSGGYNSTFTSLSGWTTLSALANPTCVISNGKVIVDRIILK